jgi:molybdate/tungstate transport system permease protein
MIFSSVAAPDTLWDTITVPTGTRSIALTLFAALIATAAGFVFGVPLAYLLARTGFPGKRFIEGLIDVPVVIPHSAAGIALLFVYGRRYLVRQFFENFGITFVDSLAVSSSP